MQQAIVNSSVAVIIPVYKTSLSVLEKETILHNIRQMKKYYIHFICPASLPANSFPEFAGNVQITYFDDEYFKSLEGYNKLLRSSLFYAQFNAYEYLLILQTDAYLFHNDLDSFLEKGYDYWGAPWIDYELINYKFLRPVLPLFHKSRYLKPLRRVFGKRYLVGNGGLSLRKVATHLLVTTEFESRIREFEKDYDTWIKGGARSMMEDIFWTLYVPAFYAGYTIAPWREALQFGFEINPQKAYELNRNQLPFGCHAFAIADPEFYKKYISILN